MKKNLLHVIVANVFYLLIVAGTNFILPKFTSVDTYAAVKEYTLYLTTFSSILTIGYLQGMYVEYGGKKLDYIDPHEIGVNIFSFLVFMLPISIVITVVGLFLHNIIITVLGVGVLSTNLQSYYQLLYQATGDFKAYGTALNVSRVALLVAYLLLMFVIKTDSIVLYVGVAPVVGISSALYLTFKLQKKIPFLKQIGFSFKVIKKNIKGGIILMLGDFVTKYFSSLDRWFVNVLMDTFSFAMYSFAVSMENLVNTFMTPITVSMYNYFCQKPSQKDICRIKEATLIYSFVIIAGAYPAKWILENFMVEYINSVDVIFPLFAAQGISTIIKGIFLNKYKAEGKQKMYLIQMISMLVLAAGLNAVFYAIYNGTISFAIATLLTNIIWLIICEKEDKEIRYGIKAVISIVIMLSVYNITGYLFNSVIGCLIYICVGIVVGMTLMRDSFLFVINSLMNSIKSKFSKVR